MLRSRNSVVVVASALLLSGPSFAQSSVQPQMAPDRAATATAQRSHDEAVAEEVRQEKERGYEPMSFDDFILDSKKLADTNAKVAVQGVYMSVLNSVEYLVPAGPGSAYLRLGQGVGLMTDGATRAVRKFFLSCARDPVRSELGCEITVLGRAMTCKRFIAPIEVPCLAVDDGWNVKADVRLGNESSPGLPERVGQCVHTRIKSIGTRLEDGLGNKVPGSGSTVTFDNGGYQVSYDTEPSVERSRPGDPVNMCLVSVPDNCPPGDDRGREYAVTNLRTRETWKLPDSQHECGGA